MELAAHLGMTVGELDQRMSQAELLSWVEYVKVNGPLNPMLRMEATIARAVVPFLGKNATVRKFMLWPREEEKVATAEDILGILQKAATQTKARNHGK